MKKVIIVGAGVSGLAAGVYAQRSGFDVTICEQHSIPGGMCTSWRRKGYLFEGAVHWLTGSSPKTALYQVWKETGALNDDVKIFLPEIFRSVEWDGQIISLFRDIGKTVERLAELSPPDKKQLLRLEKEVRAFSSMQMPVFDIKGVKARNPKRMTMGSLLKIAPAFPLLGRLGKMSCMDYARQFEHPGIQFLIGSIIPESYSAVSLIATLSTLDIGDGGYPEGGSLAIADRMAKTFTGLGGKLLLNTRVKKVNIENGKAAGVTLDDRILAADAVIVTLETIAAARLFEKPLPDPWLADLCQNTKSAACTFIGIGVRAEISQSPIPVWKFDEPVSYAGAAVTENGFGFCNYFGFEGYAPEGCTAVTTALIGDTYDFWKKARDEGRYEEEKSRLADQIKKIFCKKFPQAEGNIEVIDIATPLTYERYTGAYHGSWMTVSGPGEKMKRYPGFSQSVSGLYFAGHRLMSPGGLPVAVFTGRTAAQMVCRQFDAVFESVETF
ncbi:MAG: NAD(P)/FAD-dependent oxidoreductase [Treponema sp.]|nr:NAD(P)/FAD-dependent oxidoreductase [Treponema sp.]